MNNKIRTIFSSVILALLLVTLAVVVMARAFTEPLQFSTWNSGWGVWMDVNARYRVTADTVDIYVISINVKHNPRSTQPGLIKNLVFGLSAKSGNSWYTEQEARPITVNTRTRPGEEFSVHLKKASIPIGNRGALASKWVTLEALGFGTPEAEASKTKNYWYAQGPKGMFSGLDVKVAGADNKSAPSAEMAATGSLVATINNQRIPIDYIRISKSGIKMEKTAELGKFSPVKLEINFPFEKNLEFPGNRFAYDNSSSTKPVIQINWIKPGETLPAHSYPADDFTLEMSFGTEHEYRVPGKIHLKFKDERTGSEGEIAGEFVARTSDLVMVNGKVDTSQRNADTINYIIEEFIKQNMPGQRIRFGDGISSQLYNLESKPSKFDTPRRVLSSATITRKITLGDAAEKPLKVDMIYTLAGGWKVYRILQPDELTGLVEPDLSYDTSYAIDHLARGYIAKAFPGKSILELKSAGSAMMLETINQANPQYGHATYEIEFDDNNRDLQKIQYLKKDGQWAIQRVLAPNKIEKINKPYPFMHAPSEWEKLDTSAHRRLENTLNRKFRQPRFYMITGGCNVKNNNSQCYMAWKRIAADKFVCEQAVYVYKKNSKGDWKFWRELPASQRYDLEKSTIRPRTDRDFDYCRYS